MRVIAQTKNWCGQSMLALLLVVTSFVLMTTSAQAAELPTSENPAKGNWTVMKPSSFPAGLTSILEQCTRAAHVSNSDRLTTAMCQKLPALVQSGRCQKRLVSDGIVFDYMNGSESGRSRITFGVEKALGRSDLATICDLGNRTFAYWFTGERGKSCNNVGIVFTAPPLQPIPKGSATPPMVAPPVVIPPQEAKTPDPVTPGEDCRWVLTGMSSTATQLIVTPSRINDSCLGPNLVMGQIIPIPGGAVTTRTCVPY